MTKASNKRHARNLFIHKEMQREFAFVLIALLILSSFFISAVIHYTIQHAAFGDQALQFGKVNPYEIISQISYQIITRTTMILLATLVIIAAYGIKFLHRVAGPIYRCRKTLIALNQGKIPDPIHLRNGDFFTEVADEVNRQSDLWAAEMKRREEMVRQIDAISADAPADMRQKLAALKDWA